VFVGAMPLFNLAQSNHKATTRRSATDQLIVFSQAKVAQDPDDYSNYSRLGAAYVQKARESGDVTYYDLAEKALDKALELDPTHQNSAPILVQLATVHFSEHKFAEALREANRAAGLEPELITAYVSSGDSYLEQGDYAQAQMSYSHLQSTKPSFGTAALYLKCTREAAFDWIMGKSSEAAAQMQTAVNLADGIQLPAENIAWTHLMLAEQYFQQGDLAGSERESQSALKVYPGYHRALAEMGKIRTAQSRFQAAMNFYASAIAVIPLPSYAASLGDLNARIGRKKQAEKQYALVEYIGALGKLNQNIYNRELAVFYADHDRHLPEALQLARKEMEARHDVYSWDALAWTLVKNGRPQEAADAINKALQMGTQDALIMYHAGIIENKLGNAQKSRDYLKRALTINPHFHIFYADEARRRLIDAR